MSPVLWFRARTKDHGERLERRFPASGEDEELARLAGLEQFAVMLADEQTSPELFEIYRRMTPEQRLKAAERLWWEAHQRKADSVRHARPDWSDDTVQAELRRLILAEAMQEG